MMKIIVNAVSVKNGGAMRILTQFLLHINDDFEYIVLICDKDVALNIKSRPNLTFELVSQKKGFNRLLWDYFYLRRFIYKYDSSNIKCVVNFCNTTASIGSIPQFVYIHQALPISEFQPDGFFKSVKFYIFYRLIYLRLIKGFFAKNVRYICQTFWMRDAYSSALGVDSSQFDVFFPEFVGEVSDFNSEDLNLLTSGYSFFYPSDFYDYKNHIYLVETFSLFLNTHPSFIGKASLLFTLDEIPSLLKKKINQLGLCPYVHFTGKLDNSEVLALLNQNNVSLVFPSKVETVGLPLVEASAVGSAICVIDLPYAHEVLSNYEGAYYLPENNMFSWVDAFYDCCINQPSFASFNVAQRPGWAEFQQLITHFDN